MTSFLKMHGLGNDFAIFDARIFPLPVDPIMAKAIADRKRGIGCDQVIVMEPAKNGAAAFMRIFNADGGEVESCGNAGRCVAYLLMAERESNQIALETSGGPLFCERAEGDDVRVDMGPPRLDWREIPMAQAVDTEDFALPVPGFHDSALESAAAVMNYARETLKLDRILAITSPDNEASAKLLGKIGLRFEGMITLSEDADEVKLFTTDA